MATGSRLVEWEVYRAVLLDLDGVVTPTAEIHQMAWAELFAPWGFEAADYLQYVDGKPRYDGVRAFLASRGEELDDGEPDDPPGSATVCALGNRKNEIFNSILERDGVEPYPGTLAVMDTLDRLGTPIAVVSSSKNAVRVLEASGLLERFRFVVDGMTAADGDLAGKPDPATFLHAAQRLEVHPVDAVVVEDATSGVAAGVAGGFGLVVGVDRGGNAESLREHGAHIVVTDLGETL